VELVRTTGRPIAQVADELAIYDSTLGHWLKQGRVDRGERNGLTSDDRTRLRELEAENTQLTPGRAPGSSVPLRAAPGRGAATGNSIPSGRLTTARPAPRSNARSVTSCVAARVTTHDRLDQCHLTPAAQRGAPTIDTASDIGPCTARDPRTQPTDSPTLDTGRQHPRRPRCCSRRPDHSRRADSHSTSACSWRPTLGNTHLLCKRTQTHRDAVGGSGARPKYASISCNSSQNKSEHSSRARAESPLTPHHKSDRFTR
jgi:hypothetical protein